MPAAGCWPSGSRHRSTEPEPIRGGSTQVEACRRRAGALRASCARALRRCPDSERALWRLALGRGGPRDLLAVAQGWRAGRPAARARRGRAGACGRSPAALDAAGRPGATASQRASSDEPPLLARDGGFVRPGLQPELDELRALRDQSRRHIAALEERYRRETGIGSLKIRHNNLLGYFIEVTATHAARVPAGFVQRQGMAGATRYSTAELAELESRIASAAERALALELELFEELRQARAGRRRGHRARRPRRLAELDVAAALATLAAEQRYCRPAGRRRRRLPDPGRPPSGGRAGAGARQPELRRQRLRPRRRRPRCGC